MRNSTAALVLGIIAMTGAVAGAQRDANWPSFRGHHARGYQDGFTTPVEWNAAPAEGEAAANVRWKVKLPGLGHACPIIWGDRLFITTAVSGSGEHALRVGLYGAIRPVDDESEHTWKVYCLNKNTGEVIWQRDACKAVPKIKRHTKATHANCTMATDGKRVVAFFGSEGLYCYDLDGELQWKKDLGVLDSAFFRVPQAQWEFASSPIIHDRKVYVQCDVLKGSFVAAFDLADGREVWRTPRKDVPTWSTPTVHVDGDRTLLLVNGYKHIGGYDAKTGEELWRMAGTGDIPTPTPVVAHGLIYITQAHGGGAPIYAIKLGASGKLETPTDDEQGEHIAWFKRREGAYMQTPLVYGDYLYNLRGNGALSCYDAKTGERKYRQRLGKGGGFTASGVAGDGKLYFASEAGFVHVVKAGPEFELLASNPMGEPMLATPALSGGTLYVRTKDHVVAIANAPTAPATGLAWPQFRGIRAAGVSDAHPLPEKWDIAKGEGVLWRHAIPGLAHASPIVAGKRVFVATAVKKGGESLLKVGLYGAGDSADDMVEHAFQLWCLDLDEGRPLWVRTAMHTVPKFARHTKATHADSTPATDGKNVVAIFGAQGMVCYTVDGDFRWHVDLGDLDVGPHNAMDLHWGYASSPVIAGGKVIVQADIKKDAYLAAFDVDTGKEIWRVAREDTTSWATPTVIGEGANAQVIANGCKHMGAYALADGKAIWRMGGGGGLPVPAPIEYGELLLLTSNHRPIVSSHPRKPVFAVKRTATGDLGIPQPKAPGELAWVRDRVGNYIQTPIVYREKLYLCSISGVLTILDPKTGATLGRHRLPKKRVGFSASPVAGDGKLYFTSEQGDVHVVRAAENGEELDVLQRNPLGEICMATPAIADGKLIFRTRHHVIAVGDPPRR